MIQGKYAAPKLIWSSLKFCLGHALFLPIWSFRTMFTMLLKWYVLPNICVDLIMLLFGYIRLIRANAKNVSSEELYYPLANEATN